MTAAITAVTFAAVIATTILTILRGYRWHAREQTRIAGYRARLHCRDLRIEEDVDYRIQRLRADAPYDWAEHPLAAAIVSEQARVLRFPDEQLASRSLADADHHAMQGLK